MEAKEYLDFDEAVTFLKTTPSTLYKWLQAGKIPGHKLGRQWRFSRAELEAQISGTGPKILIQKELSKLGELLSKRSNNIKEDKMEFTQGAITENIIWDAYHQGSRAVYVYPKMGKFEIAYRNRQQIETLTEIQEETFRLINESLEKISVPLKKSDSRRFYLRHEKENHEEVVLQVRYQKLETVNGPRLTLHLWQPEKDVLPLEKITSDTQALKNFKSWLEPRSGLIVVTGVPGSGKTTTVYSLLGEYKNRGKLVFTIEDSVQMIIEGINQVETSFTAGDLEEIFEKISASDADVICLGLGSYADQEEKILGMACRAAANGTVVILQMDKPSCQEAMETIKKFARRSPEELLIGISCQRLTEQNGKQRAEYEFLPNR